MATMHPVGRFGNALAAQQNAFGGFTGSNAQGAQAFSMAQNRTNPGGYANPGGYSGFGGGLQGTTNPYQNLGSRNVGSPNFGAFSGLTNFLDTTGQAGSNYLRSLGIMPQYNGQSYDRLGDQPQRQWQQTGGGRNKSGDFSTEGQYANMDANGPVQASQMLGGGFGSAGGQAGLGGIGGGLSSNPGLDSAIGNAYTGLIGRGGHALDPAQENIASQRAADTVNRGARDAVQAARMAAARRGANPADLGDLEARINQRGASDANRARQDVATQQQAQAQQALLQSLSGAGGYLNDQQRLAILLGQAQAGQGFGQGLNMIFGA